MNEPRGCPTPGSCSAVDELADLKQRLLPQFQGRAQRAEHERDAMLEELIAARSATTAPVAWMYEENGERMFGHPDGYRPLGAVPLYAGSPPVEEKAVGHARYEYVRTLNPRRFAALYNESLMGVHQFDDLVDRYRAKGKTVDCGYDRTASLSAGHYVCTCGGACMSATIREGNK